MIVTSVRLIKNKTMNNAIQIPALTNIQMYFYALSLAQNAGV